MDNQPIALLDPAIGKIDALLATAHRTDNFPP
jgi:hypothetical protein